jgi:hypothetical protein
MLQLTKGYGNENIFCDPVDDSFLRELGSTREPPYEAKRGKRDTP